MNLSDPIEEDAATISARRLLSGFDRGDVLDTIQGIGQTGLQEHFDTRLAQDLPRCEFTTVLQ